MTDNIIEGVFSKIDKGLEEIYDDDELPTFRVEGIEELQRILVACNHDNSLATAKFQVTISVSNVWLKGYYSSG